MCVFFVFEGAKGGVQDMGLGRGSSFFLELAFFFVVLNIFLGSPKQHTPIWFWVGTPVFKMSLLGSHPTRRRCVFFFCIVFSARPDLLHRNHPMVPMKWKYVPEGFDEKATLEDPEKLGLFFCIRNTRGFAFHSAAI